MPDVNSDAKQLADRVDEERAFLEAHGHDYFREPLERASQLLRNGQIEAGVSAYLLENRGIVDIQFHPVNGDASTAQEGNRLTDQLRALHGRSYELAAALENSTKR
jgi:hypothetical protein